MLGRVTILAGVLSLASLVVGLSGADYDFEAFSEADTFIALGADAASPVLWGMWLSLFGSYLLVVPLALHLHRELRDDAPAVSDLASVGALLYILLGAAGAGVLAATAPHLMEQWSLADAAGRSDLLAQFDLARRIAEDGLQGVVQNVAGATWFIGMGVLLRAHHRGLGTTAIVIGVALVLNTLGILVDVEGLRMLGLTGTVLLAPMWAIGMGVSMLRTR
ncbi:MAG: hypothetical protein ACI867_002098, partial [Glaciecola sp.]